MRKFLALGSFALLALCFSIPASATSRWVWENATMRTSATNANGYVDSSTFSHSTAVWGAATLAVGGVDTTGAIIMAGNFAFPPSGPTTAATDSSTFALINVLPNAGAASQLDSVYVDGQVSMDGVTWINLGVTTANLGLSQGLFNSRAIPLLMEDGSGDVFARGRMRYLVGATVNSFGVTATAGTPSWAQVWGWKFIRFLIYTDGATTGHRFEIGHWVDVTSTNPDKWAP